MSTTMPPQIPETSSELRSSGYEFLDDGRCPNCHQAVEIWLTPSDRRVRLSHVIVGSLSARNRREILKIHSCE